MKKFIKLFLPVILYMVCLSVTASADEYEQYDFTYPYVIDDAGLIENDKELSERLEDIGSEYNLDIVIVTVDSLGGKTATEFADDFYDYNDYDDDGILFLIGMEYRDWAISTKGKCISAFNDNIQQEMISEMRYSLSNNDFEAAFDIFADSCEDTLHSFKVMGIVIPLGVAVVVGLIAAIIVTMIFKRQLTSVNFQRNADSYVERNSIRVTQSQNIFLYKTLSKTRRESSSSGGSGSSTHTSSSGSTHGGSSGKF